MDFDQFWDTLSEYLKDAKKLRTLKHGRFFAATMADPETVIITPESTRNPRPINKDEFRQMWNMMKDDDRDERYVSRGGRYSEFWSPAYVSALIDHIVGDQNMQ